MADFSAEFAVLWVAAQLAQETQLAQTVAIGRATGWGPVTCFQLVLAGEIAEMDYYRALRGTELARDACRRELQIATCPVCGKADCPDLLWAKAILKQKMELE